MKVFVFLVFLALNLILCERFIIQFYEEKTTEERTVLLLSEFPKSKYLFDILERNEVINASNCTSDFSVVETKSTQFIDELNSNTLIKRVSKERKYSLNSVIEDENDFSAGKSSRSIFGSYTSESAPSTRKKDVPSLLEAEKFWNKGFTCKDVKIGIFDTGLRKGHPLFNNIEEIINFTDEESSDDLNGHGTLVAGIIAGRNDVTPKSKGILGGGSAKRDRCRGLCPDSKLYIFKVFNKKNQGLTSWFLDAFNYALKLGIHIINLSNGGRDTQDFPFIEKVNELAANNVIIVSAIGNKGPCYGSLFNPGDMTSVIGVGGITYDDKISPFSSRGSSTRELQHGYGIVKPDLVTYSRNVMSIDANGYCSMGSGTSLSSPIVAGSIGLLASALPPELRWEVINPASIRQIFHDSSLLLSDISLYEQGGGKLRLLNAYHSLIDFHAPKTTVFPSKLDITDCPNMSPFCYQPIYYNSPPLVLNLTIHNSASVFSKISRHPVFIGGKNGFLLDIWYEYNEHFWPWSGTLSVHVTANSKSSFFQGQAEGLIEFEVDHSYPFLNRTPEVVQVPFRVRIVRPPKKSKCLLWDMYHNIQFPPGYVPSDDLFHQSSNGLDDMGDHPHTNFYDFYMFLRTEGYFVGSLTQPYTKLPKVAKDVSTLVMADLEEEYTPAEREALLKMVREDGLSLLVIANWYSVEVIEAMESWDEETKRMWRPITGGSNIPALNALLDPVGIAFGDGVWEGKFDFSKKERKKTLMSYISGFFFNSPKSQIVNNNNYNNNYDNHDSSTEPLQTYSSRMKGIYASGTRIIRFPKNGYLWFETLNDRTSEVIRARSGNRWVSVTGGGYALKRRVPILGMTEYGKGRIVVFGDSGCLDSQTIGVLGPQTFGERLYSRRYQFDPKIKLAFNEESCFEFLQALLEYAGTGRIPDELRSESKIEEDYVDVYSLRKPPVRPRWADDEFWEFSILGSARESVRSEAWWVGDGDGDNNNNTNVKYNWRDGADTSEKKYLSKKMMRRGSSHTLYIAVLLLGAGIIVFIIMVNQGSTTNSTKHFKKEYYYQNLDRIDFMD